MTIETTSIFEHSTHKTQLTEHTMFSLTWCRDMRFSKMPDRQGIVHELDERISIAVAYVRLEPTEGRLVVKPEIFLGNDGGHRLRLHTQSQNLQRRIWNTRFRHDDSVVESGLLYVRQQESPGVSDGLIMTRTPLPCISTYNCVITTSVAPEAGLLFVRVGDCSVSLATQGSWKVGVRQSANFLEVS